MLASPSPSPRKRANTVDSPNKSWSVSSARIPVERPVSALRSPIKPAASMTPSRIALPASPMPKFDLRTTIEKPSPRPTRLKGDSPKKEVIEYEVPIFDFSMRGTTAQKPAALRRKPLMATAGQAASQIVQIEKPATAVVGAPDKPTITRAAIVPESAVGLRVKRAQDVPLPALPMMAPGSRTINRLKKAPESIPLPASPLVVEAARVLGKPGMRSSQMRSSSEASQRSIAALDKLSPSTKKHVAPQLLDKSAAAASGSQSRRKAQQAAKAVLDGSGLGLSPTKAAKPPVVHIGPSKTRKTVESAAVAKPQPPAVSSPKLERQVVDGEVFLVSSKALTLQTKLQISPRSSRTGSASPKQVKLQISPRGIRAGSISPKPASSKGKSPETKPLEFHVMKNSKMQPMFSNKRIVSDNSAAADDERGKLSKLKTKQELERKISESEAHVLAVDPKIQKRKPATRRLNVVSDSVLSNSSKHFESIEYQAKQYIAHTLTAKSLLDLDDGFQKDVKATPLVKSSPIKTRKVSAEEAAYQAMLKKAYIDERPKLEVKLSRPRSRHRYGSSGQTQIGAVVRDGSSSEFEVDFLRADASQKIIQETFEKLDMFKSPLKVAQKTQLSPIREPVSPRKSTLVGEGRNFGKRAYLSPAKRVRALELELPVENMDGSGNGFALSSDHPLSPLRKAARPAVSSTARNDDPFAVFEDVSLDDDLAVELALHGTSLDELDKRATELENLIDAMEKSQKYEVDNSFVDRAAELGVMVEAVEKTQSLQMQVDRQLFGEMLNNAAAPDVPHKSALSLSHRAAASGHKSVRWDPSIDSVDSPVVPEKAVEEAWDKKVVKEKKSKAVLDLENVFKYAGFDGEEAAEIERLLSTVKGSKRGGKPKKFVDVLKLLQESLLSEGSSADEDEEKEKEKEKEKMSSGEDVVLAKPVPKLNPLCAEFRPRNMKENEAWGSTFETQPGGMAMPLDQNVEWNKPNALHDASFDDPAILSFATANSHGVSENLFHDPAVLSISPGRIRNAYNGGVFVPSAQQPMSENFVDSLFSSGDPAILSIRHSPGRRQRSSSQQTFTTAAISVPGPATTPSIRKRVIWDNPNEPGGREAVIQSKKYSEECLEKFTLKYPLTGQKAKVLPKKRLEDLPRRIEPEVTLRPMRLDTEAAEIQQKLEVLLLKKKEDRVRLGSAGWGVVGGGAGEGGR